MKKITNEGEKILLKRMTAGSSDTLSLRLIAASITPSDSVVLTDITKPTWHTDVVLVNANWETPTTSDLDRGVVEYPEIEISHTLGAPENIYGIALYETSTDKVVSVETFTTELEIDGTGSFFVTPRLIAYDTADSV